MCAQMIRAKAEKVDIIISGAGIAGLVASAAFGEAGFQVICLDPAPPVTERDAQGADLRTTAFLQPARNFLDQIGLWDRFASEASALQVMRIVDAGDKKQIIREFNAADISDAPFGWNIPNWFLRRELMTHLETLKNVRLHMGAATRSVLTRDRQVIIHSSDTKRFQARLLIGADGRNSSVRQAVGIKTRIMRYGQKALTFAVTHPIPHNNVSTEIHRSGGPFTLVPLPDYQGRPCSAVVWMEQGAKVKQLAKLDENAFEAEMTARSSEVLGPLLLVSRRTIWPIISQIADRLVGQRTALIAEAAHVVPPIGAQGLNMSLADIQALYDLAVASPEQLGEARMLDQYHRQRHGDIAMRVKGIDLLNRASMAHTPALRAARAYGLDALYALPPVRRMLMQMGLGVHLVQNT